MKTLTQYCIECFGEKAYKLSINAGMTCPNRDGTLDTRGCIFCSSGGSGEFASDSRLSITKQLEQARQKVAQKYHGHSYIAYFQAFTNTYAPVEKLEKLYHEAMDASEIVALSIATRPDCLTNEIISLLECLNKIKPVWVELGLQTIHERTAKYVRRGYGLPVYDHAVTLLNKAGIHTITHVILGLPGETRENMLDTVRHVVDVHSGGIKLQLLHVLEGTDLARDYREGLFDVMSLEDYVSLIISCVRLLPEDMVLHRMTGDGAKNELIAPLWSADKKRVLNELNKALKTL